MARGTQLQQLVIDLRAETRQSLSVAAGLDNADHLKTVIRRIYEFEHDGHLWPHLRVKPTKTLYAGQRYYDMPATLEIERITQVWAWWNSEPHELTRGVGIEEYAAYDSDSDERADPPISWDMVNTGAANTDSPQIEIWPIPISEGGKLQFIGNKVRTSLTSDSDACDLDDRLIVLLAAAEILASQGARDAEAKAALAAKRQSDLLSNENSGRRPFVMGGGRPDTGRTGHNIIRVSYSPTVG